MEIIRIITQLANTLNFDMVGEGIETEEQLLFMQALGCNIIQGYYFSKPLSLKALKSYLLSQS